MRTLISEHEVHQITISWTFLLSLIALPAARLALVASDLALATVGASFGRFTTVDHDGDQPARGG